MISPNAPTGQPRPHQSQAAPTKTPRAELVILQVDADDCPQILLRVLGIISRNGSIPATISATRSDDRIEIAIELDGISGSIGERIARKVAEFPAVRKVLLAGRRVG
ncbi:hypothetical protein CA223_15225 [Sphingomonas koreensis]|uniref:hypothetical protein n=1 Tax=Sphingomonas koreensis TaxID=93064 RepID=UPI000F7466F6|nr:hypothetical protein [Sphingomonas koreensis]RSU30599.1 hypothetical protein CA222_00510 [Sphingomonas koreensis]RSU36964.1 hypothetical protein CA223_15225 [Sphingomonas koreensis]RSU84635.1 hypothetical protein DAH54_04960 [Sphingomonas koreensis]RSU85349.1 hypothetical protein DAH53_00510 [Sphingomonas koreensis]RSU95067.1 hypothetical protein DAH52_09650 [Sphingomonas koreensis]